MTCHVYTNTLHTASNPSALRSEGGSNDVLYHGQWKLITKKRISYREFLHVVNKSCDQLMFYHKSVPGNSES